MYTRVVLGGTFDHFHAGHRDLLDHAFSIGKRVTIGLTKASMNTKKKYARQIQSFAIRKQSIFAYVATIGRASDVDILPIHDIYGNTLTDTTLEAIVVTPHTENGAIHINDARVQNGLRPLPISVCPLHLDTHGNVLCSSNIRAGVVNHEGNYTIDLFGEDRVLSEAARTELRLPFGMGALKSKIIAPSPLVALVGDVVTDYCIQHAIDFDFAYIDGISRKQPYEMHSEVAVTPVAITNPAGQITSKIGYHIAERISELQERRRNEIFKISGEEDLLTVATVLLAPLGSIIVYGYPYQPTGMRMISVTDRIKSRFANIISI